MSTCPLTLTATGELCGGTLSPSGIEGFDMCSGCGTWVQATNREPRFGLSIPRGPRGEPPRGIRR